MNPCVIAVGIFLTTSPTSPVPDAGGVSFDEVIKTVEARRQLYHVNKRVVGTVKIYAIEAKDGGYAATLGADFDSENVCDAAGNRRGTITATRSATRKANTGSYVAADIAYTVFPDGDGYAIREFVVRAENPFGYLRDATLGPAWFPSSFNGTLSVEVAAAVLAGQDRATHGITLGPATRTTWRGRKVVAIASTMTPKGTAPAHLTGGVVQQMSYFDPGNAYAYLGSEATSEAPSQSRPWAHRTVCELEYAPRPGGAPVPKRFTRHVQPEKGEKLLEYEVEYTRFEDYTPTPEDFQLEGRYGLTTPAGPEGKALVGVRSSTRSRAWLWAAVAGGVVLPGVGAFLVRRRRKMRAAPAV